MSSSLLLWLILIPIIGGLLCWLSERFNQAYPRWIALSTSILLMFLALYFWFTGDFSAKAPNADVAFQTINNQATWWPFFFKVTWIEQLGISIYLAMDGLSVLLIVLTGILGIASVLCSWEEIEARVGFFYLNLMWILGGVIGVFLAADLFLFFLFWEVMLIPMFFLIALWGHSGSDGKTRIYAATKFFIFTQASGLLMLISIITLALKHYTNTGTLTFDYTQLIGTQLGGLEFILMLGFFIAFAVKFPVVPIHSWLPDAHAQAPTAGSVDLAGILLKTAAFGMLRFAIPLFPNASMEFAPIAIWLGLIGIVYGAIVAFQQTDIKRLIAYTSISHMGFILIGIYSGSELALQGVVIQMIAHGFSASALFIGSGQLYKRLHTRDMTKMGGLWGKITYLPAIMLFFNAASLGLPGTGNFVGEFMILIGAFPAAKLVVSIATFGLVLASIYSLIVMQRVFYGTTRSDFHEPIQGLCKREITMMFVLIVLLLLLGIYPQPVLDTSAMSMGGVHSWFSSQLVPR